MPEYQNVPKITITGDLGSGKSLAARMLMEATGFTLYSTGKIQREIAHQHGMSTLDLNRYAETHPEIDSEIDGYSIKLGRSDESLIVDSRLAWFFIPASFKIYLAVDVAVAAQRIYGDTGRQSEAYSDLAAAREQILARKSSENKRFLERYGADCTDMSQYDLVLDTSALTPEQVLARILDAFTAWRG